MARRPHLILRFLAAAAAASLPWIAAAAVPVALYPLQSEGLTDGERTEVQAVVESALLGTERRGVLEPRSPLVLPAACKPPITVGCVATQAKGGVVLYAKAKRRGAQILVTVLFVDAVGRKTRAVAFPVDLFIQNLRPANDAIASVEADLVAGVLEDPTPVPAPRPPVERPKTVEAPQVVSPEPPPAEKVLPEQTPPAQTPEVAVAPPPPREPPRASPEPPVPPQANVPIDLAVTMKSAPEPSKPQRVGPRAPEKEAPETGKSGSWRLTAGRWCAGGGVAMLLTGTVVGLTGKRLGDTLTDRYERGLLRPGDVELYDRVDRYERISNVLLLAGGVASAAGFGLIVIAPTPGGATVAIAGAF